MGPEAAAPVPALHAAPPSRSPRLAHPCCSSAPCPGTPSSATAPPWPCRLRLPGRSRLPPGTSGSKARALFLSGAPGVGLALSRFSGSAGARVMAPVTCTCIQGFPFENVFGLFTSSGHLDPAEKVEDAHPKLWCALSEGKVIVFDASSWTIHQHCFRVGTSKLVSKQGAVRGGTLPDEAASLRRQRSPPGPGGGTGYPTASLRIVNGRSLGFFERETTHV